MSDEYDDKPADADQADGADDEIEGPAGAATTSSRAETAASRKQLKKRAKSELKPWWRFQARDPAEPVDVTVSGRGIGKTQGETTAVGAAMQRVGGLYKALVGSPGYVDNLAWENSVTIRIRPNDEDVKRARDALRTVAELEGQEKRASEERRPEIEQRLEEAVERSIPDVYMASKLAANLLSATPKEAPALAIRHGSGVAQAYRTLANAAVRNEFTIAIHVPGEDKPTQLTPEKAKRVAEELKHVAEPEEFVVIAFGVLSIADATQKTFGLRLDARRRRPDVLRGKQIVRGTYTEEVEQQIIEDGLWGKAVRAKIRVERDAVVSSSTIRPPVFELMAVERSGSD